MEDVLARALEPVLRDLRKTGIPEPRVIDNDWTDIPDLATAALLSRLGRTGISVHRLAPEDEQVAAIAEQVQEVVIEDLWIEGQPTNWPQCPNHRATHPLTAATRDGVAVWICPTGGTTLARIGNL